MPVAYACGDIYIYIYIYISVCVCVCEFQDEILLRGGECKTHENFKSKFFRKMTK